MIRSATSSSPRIPGADAFVNYFKRLNSNRPNAASGEVSPEPGKAAVTPCSWRGDGLSSILGNLEQSMFGEYLYKTREERAAHLLYFVINNHPFSDGNKRSGAFLFLHNIGDEPTISPTDALLTESPARHDYVLANPPFGKKSTMTVTNAAGEQEKEDFVYNRQDFWATTSNKQLNFVQHIRTMLKENGQAAAVLSKTYQVPTVGVPENVGAGTHIVSLREDPGWRWSWRRPVVATAGPGSRSGFAR